MLRLVIALPIVWLMAAPLMTGGGHSAPTPPSDQRTDQGGDLATPLCVPSPHLANVVRLHARVLSGGTPEGDAAFAALHALGVRTIVSVDGMRPDAARATRHGLRYVHLPIGYDRVPDARVRELAKALVTFDGVLYVHCHHGKHRAPAAASAACVAAGLISPEQAEAVLRAAGTGDAYHGLRGSVRAARALDPTVLQATAATFTEQAPLSPLVEAMASIDRSFERLRRLASNDWQPASSDAMPPMGIRDAAHEALLLREQFAELTRAGGPHDDDAAGFANAAALAGRLHRELNRSRGLRHQDTRSKLDEGIARLDAACVRCHERSRDRGGGAP